jgi:hypothetical protein
MQQNTTGVKDGCGGTFCRVARASSLSVAFLMGIPPPGWPWHFAEGLAFAQAFDGFLVEQGVRFLEDVGNPVGEPVAGQGGLEFVF